MAPGGRIGPQLGKLFLHVFIQEKYFENLFKNHWARKTEIYKKALSYSKEKEVC
jgi:hypothetical protein